MKKHKVGNCPDGRIGIRNSDGALVGHCGPHAIAGTVRRFGLKNPQLKNINGRLEWHDGGQSSGNVRRPSADRKHSLGSVKS
jgi:hypothetical protein